MRAVTILQGSVLIPAGFLKTFLKGSIQHSLYRTLSRVFCENIPTSLHFLFNWGGASPPLLNQLHMYLS